MIVDLASSDQERIAWAAKWDVKQPFPPTFLPIALCHASKLQSIPRAELEAIVFVVENFTNTCVYTDSTYALHAAEEIKSVSDLGALQMHPDADLLERLWKATQSGQRKYHKVKAHDLDNTQDDLLTKYRKIGNHVADHMANRAMHTQLKQIANTSDKLNAKYREYHNKLAEY